MIAPLVGAFFRPPAQRVLGELASGCPLELRREPENPYDPNAVGVWLAQEYLPSGEDFLAGLASFGIEPEEYLATPSLHLGYIAKGQAPDYHPFTKGKLIFSPEGKPLVQVGE